MTDNSTVISALPQASSAGVTDDLVINVNSGSAYTTERIVLSAFKSSIFNSPTLVTPTLGVATATSLNGNTITVSSGTLTLGAGKVLTASNTLTFTGTDGSSVAFGAGGTVLYSGGAYAASIAGTANEITASAATGAVTLSLPTALTFTGKTVTGGTFASPTISGTVAGAHTYSGALTLSAALTYGGVTLTNNVTGTGKMVLDTSPTLVTPALGTPASGVGTNITGIVYSNVTGAPTFVGTRITSTQASATGTTVKVQLNGIRIDTGSYWDGTNFYYKPLVAGTYQVSGSVYITGTGITQVEVAISKNGTSGSGGTEVVDVSDTGISSSGFAVAVPASFIAMNGSTDTLELNVTAVGTSPVIQSVRSTTQMAIKWVGP